MAPKVKAGLLRKCDAEQNLPTHEVADFAPTPRYTVKGTNPEDNVAKGMTNDFRRAYRQALCYRLSRDDDYASEAQAIMDAWAGKMKSASSAQGRGSMNFNAAQLVVAASWVEGTNGWNAGPFKSWLLHVITPLSLSGEPNNRGNWGVFQDIAIASLGGDTAAMGKAAERWQQLLATQVAGDGTLPSEICRSNTSKHCDGPEKGVNGMAYTHFTLLPAMLGAEILAEQGLQPFDGAGGKALLRAFEKAATFTRYPEQFPYYASNQGKLNKLDHCAYFALALRRLPNADAKAVVLSGQCKSDYWLLQAIYSQ